LDAVRNDDTNIAKTLICNKAMIQGIKDTQGVSIIEYSDTNNNKYLSKLLTDNNLQTLCSNKKSTKKPEPIVVQSVRIDETIEEIENEEITLYNELLNMLQTYDATMNEDHLSVVINNSVIFSKNRSVLSKKGKSFIQEFYPQYLDKLLKYQSKIENITIEVHASSDNRTAKTKQAKYEANQRFTQKRANKLLAYMKQINNPLIKSNAMWMKNTHEAKGMSSKETIYSDDKKEDKLLSQRIKIKIKFKKEAN
jgi:flagellar motor protein MotB